MLKEILYFYEFSLMLFEQYSIIYKLQIILYYVYVTFYLQQGFLIFYLYN